MLVLELQLSALIYNLKAFPSDSQREKNEIPFEIPEDTVLQEGTSSRGPKLGSCLTFENELSEETHLLTKQRFFVGTQVRVSRKEPKTAVTRLAVSGFYGDGITFRVVF